MGSARWHRRGGGVGRKTVKQVTGGGVGHGAKPASPRIQKRVVIRSTPRQRIVRHSWSKITLIGVFKSEMEASPRKMSNLRCSHYEKGEDKLVFVVQNRPSPMAEIPINAFFDHRARSALQNPRCARLVRLKKVIRGREGHGPGWAGSEFRIGPAGMDPSTEPASAYAPIS